MATRTLLSVVLLATLFVVCLAMPTLPSNDSTLALQRRQCVDDPNNAGNYICDDNLPTLSEIVARMRDASQGGVADSEHMAVFYTNLDDPSGGQAWMHTWLVAHGFANKYFWFGNSLSMKWFETQLDHIMANPKLFEPRWGKKAVGTFSQCLWVALGAAPVRPDAYLFTPKGVDWKKTSTWHREEYPALTSNTNIQRIWRVDPRPPDVRGIHPPLCLDDEAELLWDRGRGDQPFSDDQTITCQVV